MSDEHRILSLDVMSYPGGKNGLHQGRCKCGYSTSPGSQGQASKALTDHLLAARIAEAKRQGAEEALAHARAEFARLRGA